MRVFWKRMAALATGLFLLFNGEAAVRSAVAEDPKGEVFKPELIKEEGTFFPKTEDEETPGEKKLSVEDYMERYRRHRYPMDWNCWPYVPAVTQAPSSPNTGVATSEVIPVTAEVVQSEANIRERANSTAGLLLRLGPGEQVTVLGQTTGADHRVWYRVRCENGTVGYVRYDRVDVICGTAQFGGSTEPTGRCIGQTNTRAVNVRLQMSKESGRIRLLRKGQSVTVIGRARDAFSTEWYYVRIPTGPLGYIQGSFLTVISGTVADAWRETAETGTGYNGAVGNAGYTDYSGYTGTFVIPDSTPVVITYRTRITAQPGEAKTFRGTARLKDTDGNTIAESTAGVTSEAVVVYPSPSDVAGFGDNFMVKLYVYADGKMQEGIEKDSKYYKYK